MGFCRAESFQENIFNCFSNNLLKSNKSNQVEFFGKNLNVQILNCNIFFIECSFNLELLISNNCLDLKVFCETYPLHNYIQVSIIFPKPK